MEVDEEIRDTCVASEIRHADSTCTYIKKDKGISLKAVTPPQLLFRIKRNYERKKEEAKVSRKLSLYFFFSECIMHLLCNVLPFVCTAKQRAKTLTTISLTLRSLGFKLDQRTLYIMPPFVSPEI